MDKWIDVIAPNAGNFEIPHGLGRIPADAHLEVTCMALLVWQPKMFDENNLYFQTSERGATGRVRVK